MSSFREIIGSRTHQECIELDTGDRVFVAGLGDADPRGPVMVLGVSLVNFEQAKAAINDDRLDGIRLGTNVHRADIVQIDSARTLGKFDKTQAIRITHAIARKFNIIVNSHAEADLMNS